MSKQVQKPKPTPRPSQEPPGAPTVNKRITRLWFS